MFDSVNGEVFELLRIVMDIAAKHNAFIALSVANLVHAHMFAKGDHLKHKTCVTKYVCKDHTCEIALCKWRISDLFAEILFLFLVPI